MSAATRILVKVAKRTIEVVEVEAVTLDEAKAMVEQMPDVLAVLDARYPRERENNENTSGTGRIQETADGTEDNG